MKKNKLVGDVNEIIVEDVNEILKVMVKDWSKDPLMFYSEHDVQAEIFRRLKGYLELRGLLYVEGLKEFKFDKCDIEKDAGQKWHRLHCEVHLKCKNPPRGINPDIIIWDNLDDYNIDEKKYLDIVYNFKNNWPMIWACEIKYYHSGARQIKNYKYPDEFDELLESGQQKDKNNMEDLLKQGDNKDKNGLFGTKHATIINFYRRKGKDEPGTIIDNCYAIERICDDKLTIINAFLPEKSD